MKSRRLPGAIAAFTPSADLPLGAVMIRWTQGAVPAQYP